MPDEMSDTGASQSAGLTNEGPWKCFHCWEVFIDAASAEQHFGPWPENHNFPRCAPKRYREQIKQLTAERDEARTECAKAERLWKQEAIRAERAETTLGGMENATRIALAKWEKAEAALHRIAITDDADCAHANDPKAMTRIAREALR